MLSMDTWPTPMTCDARDPWGFKFDYAVNNSAWNEEDTGFWAEIWRGKLHDKGSVHYGLQYIRVEADAVLSFLNKDEVQTNVKGTRAHFATRVQHNMDWFYNLLFIRTCFRFSG